MRSAALASTDAMPEFATPRPRSAVRTRVISAKNSVPVMYESGATQSRRAAAWRAPTAPPNGMLGSLGTIRDRSRAAVRNDGYAKGAIDKLVTNLIGTGIKPLSQAPDPAWRALVQALWLRWTDESDAEGQLDFYGQQAQATRVWLEGGDSYGRMRNRLPEDGLSVPLQIQVLEPELSPYSYDGFNAVTGNRIRAGIEFDRIGRRVAYYFHPTRPDFNDFDASQLVAVPADMTVHLYDAVRAGQLRGLPILTQALLKLHELDKYDDATLIRQQIANLFAMFVTREAGPTDLEQINPLTGLAVDATDESPMVQMDPGIVQELNPGENVTFSTPPDPPANYADFLRTHLRAVAVATGVPYELLTGDMSGMNDRTVRVVLNEFKRRMQMVQHTIIAFKFCRPIWNAWIDRAILAGALPTPAGYGTDPAKPWALVKWTPQRWAYIHPVQDIQAQKDEVRAGFTSRAAIVSENGEDAEEIDREQADDNTRADSLGLRYDSDGRQPAAGPRETFTEGGTPNDPAQAPAGAAA